MIDTPTPVFPYSMATLRYSLLTDAVELAPLRVLATRCVGWQAWSVTFCVLGASHAVCLERGESRLTELLACVLGAGASVPVVPEEGEESTTLCLRAEGLVCETTLTPFALSGDAELSAAIALDNRMEVAYPPHLHSATPYTRIGWHATADTLHVETVHTYPEEGRGVRSRTVFREETALP